MTHKIIWFFEKAAVVSEEIQKINPEKILGFVKRLDLCIDKKREAQ